MEIRKIQASVQHDKDELTRHGVNALLDLIQSFKDIQQNPSEYREELNLNVLYVCAAEMESSDSEIVQKGKSYQISPVKVPSQLTTIVLCVTSFSQILFQCMLCKYKSKVFVDTDV